MKSMVEGGACGKRANMHAPANAGVSSLMRSSFLMRVTCKKRKCEMVPCGCDAIVCR